VPAGTATPDDAEPLDAGVRRAAETMLGRSAGDVSFRAVDVDPHLRIHSVTGGVVRVEGAADGEPFSLVVKKTRHGTDPDPAAMWVSGEHETHRNYWKREWLAYTSGVLGRLPGRLRAPRLLHATEPAAGEAWLFLEHVVGRPGTAWGPQHYARGAHDLGTTQGAFAAGSMVLPDDGWLSRGWLDEWVGTASRWWPLVDDDAAWRDDRLAPMSALRPRARDVWAGRDRLLEIVHSAPQTVVHLDLWPTNVMIDPDGRAVAIDWSSVGLGALAQDLDQLTLDPVWMQVLPGADLGLLERAVVPSYAWGVRSAGYDASDAEVRRWYAAAAGVRQTSVLGTQADLATDPARVDGLERRWKQPFEAIVADRARALTRSIELAEEALGPV
jgi:phosphotransferase family enzyme